jgi:hypothetical protein
MSEAVVRALNAVVDRALLGSGVADAGARRAAFDNAGVDERARGLIDTVARNAWKVTDGQVEAAKRAGLSEDEIFELVVCAALGQSTRQLASALAAVDEATQSAGAGQTAAGIPGGRS